MPVLHGRRLKSPRQTTHEVAALFHSALGEQLRPRDDRDRYGAGVRRPHPPHSDPIARQMRQIRHELAYANETAHGGGNHRIYGGGRRGFT